MELTGKQRARLRAMANSFDPILHIGKEGIGENLLKQGDDALEARELIKVQVMKNAPYDTREACDRLCEALHAAPVTCVGYKFVIYRESLKHKKIELS